MGGTRTANVMKVTISLLLAAVLLAWFLSRVPLAVVWQTILRVHVGWTSASVGLALASYVLRALRWGLILRPVGEAPAGPLIGATAAGFAASAILPARAGEVVRPLLLSYRTGLPAAGALASIVTERLIDGASVLVLFMVSVAFASLAAAPAQLAMLHRAALLTGAGLAVAVVFFIILLRHRDATIAMLSRFVPARFQTRVAPFLAHLLDGLEVLRSPRRLAEVAAWSGALWFVIALQLVALARAFAIDMTLTGAFVTIAVSVVGLAVPTPAGVGGFHAAVQFALVQFLAVDVTTATAYALLHHAICFVPITFIGLAYLGATGLSLGRVRSLDAAPIRHDGTS